MKKTALLLNIVLFVSCNSSAQKKENKDYKITKTESEWKAQLSDISFYVLRKSGTEPAFSSPLNKNHEDGIYICAGCDTPLFEGRYKYDSGSGWPSFDREIEGNVAFGTDRKLGYSRNEEHCATCGGHLGHVFDDGPRQTTGKRHCINGAALKFIPKENN